MATEPTEKDKEFISSFKQYVDDIVEESCYEASGLDSIADDELKAAGKKLMAESAGLKIHEDVEKLVGIVDDLAKNYVLVPDMSTTNFGTPKGNSLKDAESAMRKLKDYFDDIGFFFDAGTETFNDLLVLSIVLGKGRDIKAGELPPLYLITDIEIANTGTRIMGESTNEDMVCPAWTDGETVYIDLNLALLEGQGAAEHLLLYGQQGKKENMKTKPEDYAKKLDQLAWAPLFKESMDDFIKEYAAIKTGDRWLHEFHHTIFNSGGYANLIKAAGQIKPTATIRDVFMTADDEALMEAAGPLYQVIHGKNTFDSLCYLYDSMSLQEETHLKGSRLALSYLKRVGYNEALWKDLEPGSDEAKKAEIGIRGLANEALKLIEKEKGLPKHEEAESRLNFGEKYQNLTEQIESVVMGQKYVTTGL